MLRHLVVLTSLALILTIAWGCDDRGTGLEPVDLGDQEGVVGFDHSLNPAFVPDLTLQLKNPQELLLGSAMWPISAAEVPPRHPMPLLILLAPQYGSRQYYFTAGLDVLYRELVASGEIQDMVIACIGNDQTFGGYFYGNSDAAGMYDSIFHYDPATGDFPDDLVDILHMKYPATIELPGKRGIGGIGQGAYGAFRVLIKNPGVFTSVSVADGPLDFDGPNGNSGLLSLFDDVLAEQHAHYALNPTLDDNDNPLPFNFRRDFDSSIMMPISQMFIGGALAFSPDDTLITYDRVVTNNFMTLENVVHYRISDTLTDSSTFISDLIVSGERSTRWQELDFHLPFDENGVRNDAIWVYWMANNLEDMFESAGGNPLNGVSMWFGTNSNAKWGYHDMTMSWIDYLRSLPDYSPPRDTAITVYRYSSFQDDPITGDEYLFDLLRQMLIFHSNNFGD